MASWGAFQKRVAVAGTAERLISTAITVGSVTIQPCRGDTDGVGINTGNVYLGDSTVSLTGTTGYALISDGGGLTFSPAGGNSYSLNDLWINADNAGDGVEVIYNII